MARVNKDGVKKVKKSGGDSNVYTALLALALGSLIAAVVVVVMQGQEMYGEIFKITS